ncbi:MAG TPA: hypothetical protein VJQ45_03095, partial [Ktedonobacterales bacterium]|nr:hypothetical protein [Ktedonobacterales bacterium]
EGLNFERAIKCRKRFVQTAKLSKSPPTAIPSLYGLCVLLYRQVECSERFMPARSTTMSDASDAPYAGLRSSPDSHESYPTRAFADTAGRVFTRRPQHTPDVKQVAA